MAESVLAEPYQNIEQKKHAAEVGMWIFLATEVLFFGGMFLVYTVYRVTYPAAFIAVSRELNFACGTLNTAILLTSSLTMALAVRAAKLGERKHLTRFLAGTLVFGLCFMAVKAYEYRDDIEKHLVFGPSSRFQGPRAGPEALLLFLYYTMTAIHALHLTIGIGLVTWVLAKARRGDFSSSHHDPVVITGLYWHFVDVVWVFLYPLLYLIGRHS